MNVYIKDKPAPPSRLHRISRGFLVLIAFACAVGFSYFSQRQGIITIPQLKCTLAYPILTLATPFVGLLALMGAVLIEYHERHQNLVMAFVRTFKRFRWMLVVVILLAIWIWWLNHS